MASPRPSCGQPLFLRSWDGTASYLQHFDYDYLNIDLSRPMERHVGTQLATSQRHFAQGNVYNASSSRATRALTSRTRAALRHDTSSATPSTMFSRCKR